jgi:hypothetical protein
MLSTAEVQVRATTLAQSVLTSLRQHPQCLPPAELGLQLQRVRLKSAALRNNKTSSFQIDREMGSHDQGLGWVWIEGRQVQLAVDVTIDVAQTATIAANPNKLVASELSADVTVVFDLDAAVANAPGWVEVSYRLADIQPAGTPAGLTPQWVIDQLTARLAMKPFPLDLSALVSPGLHFANAGLAMDQTATFAAVRAELSGHPAMVSRWMQFHNGGIVEHIGGHDWSVFALGDQLAAALGLKVGDALRKELGDDQDWLITVGAEFQPQPGRAVFILTPYLKLPGVGTESVPLSITLSVDAQAGNFLVDIDAFGLRDKINSLRSIAFTIIRVAIPIAGPFIAALLDDAIAGAIQSYSAKGAGSLGPGLDALPGASAAATVTEDPGEPFRYRATLPLPTPPMAQGRMQELITYPSGFSLAGSWAPLNFRDGELQIAGGRFGWQAPRVACGSPGEAVLREIAIDPKKYVWLLARIELAVTGSSSVRLCSVTAFNLPDASTGVQLQWAPSELSTHIDIIAPATLLDSNLTVPIEIEVRTTIGVFRSRIAPPQPLTQADLNKVRTQVLLQLRWCDARVKPAWFRGNGGFDLDWIDDPLIDPDRSDREVALVQLEVSGLRRNSRVVVEGPHQTLLGSALASADGFARLQFAHQPGTPAPLARVQIGARRRHAAASSRNGGVALFRLPLTLCGGLRFFSAVRAIAACPGAGASRFLAVQDESLSMIDARQPDRPVLAGQWRVPGLQGAVAAGRNVLAYGDAGVFLIETSRPATAPAAVQRSVVVAAAGWIGGVVLVTACGGVHVCNSYGIVQSRLDDLQKPRAAMVLGGSLLVACDTHVAVFRVADLCAPRRSDSWSDLSGTRFLQSGIDGTPYLRTSDGHYAELGLGPHGWGAVATFADEPWVARAARSGSTVVHLGNGFELRILRLGRREMALAGNVTTMTRELVDEAVSGPLAEAAASTDAARRR